MTNMDKLYEAVEARGPVCVGLDTDFSYLPQISWTAPSPRARTSSASTRSSSTPPSRRGLLQGADRLLRVSWPRGSEAYADTLKLSARPVCRSSPTSSAATSPRPLRCTPWATSPATLRPTLSRWLPTWAWTPSALSALRREAGQGYVRPLPHLQRRRKGFRV